MNYQNYLDSPQAGPGSNPRQAPQSPSQNTNHANGMNGGMGMGGAMAGYPTPAGHQADLNYVYGLVEDLSAQLAINREYTDRITEHMGKIRAKALNMNLTNDELIAAVAQELNGETGNPSICTLHLELTFMTESSKNLEIENSQLRKTLEKTTHDKQENWKLAAYGANILADILEKTHKYKEQHESDTLAWHKNYRKQLAHEREVNLNLNCQINDMKAAACRASAHLRDMRRWFTDHDELNEVKIQNIALRQEKRMWKRMALPLIPDDDSEWSDDDDLIDPEEKKRQAAAKAEKEKLEKEAGIDEGPSPNS